MNNLEKEFIPYQESLELKELGFDEPCFGYRDGAGHLMIKPMPHCVISAPTFSQAFRWFREKHGWVAEINGSPQHTHFYANQLLQAKGELRNSKICDTYEEAELVCLRELIKVIKNKL